LFVLSRGRIDIEIPINGPFSGVHEAREQA
jgi:hypothetical protein